MPKKANKNNKKDNKKIKAEPEARENHEMNSNFEHGVQAEPSFLSSEILIYLSIKEI